MGPSASSLRSPDLIENIALYRNLGCLKTLCPEGCHPFFQSAALEFMSHLSHYKVISAFSEKRSLWMVTKSMATCHTWALLNHCWQQYCIWQSSWDQTFCMAKSTVAYSYSPRSIQFLRGSAWQVKGKHKGTNTPATFMFSWQLFSLDTILFVHFFLSWLGLGRGGGLCSFGNSHLASSL